MTTNETFFVRDKVPRTPHSRVDLPRSSRCAGPQKHRGIWCAAAYQGQEHLSWRCAGREARRLAAGGGVGKFSAKTDLSQEVMREIEDGRE